jgi:hypothetical protein
MNDGLGPFATFPLHAQQQTEADIPKLALSAITGPEQVQQIRCVLLDHLVGEQLHRIGNRESQGLRSLEIDHELEFG